MLTTRRSQAMHDLLTRSTVQVRDLASAGPKLYVHEQSDLANPALPSRTRRILVIAAYVIASSALSLALLAFLLQHGFVSDRCLGAVRCSVRDSLVSYAVRLGWFATCVFWLWLGWRGRLFGCRVG